MSKYLLHHKFMMLPLIIFSTHLAVNFKIKNNFFMKKKSKQTTFLVISAFLLIGVAVVVVNNYKTKTSFKYKSQNASETKPEQHSQDAVTKAVNEEAKALTEIRKNSDILKISSNDFVLGDKSAPVTMVEYASLSCPHCASFARESFNRVKKDYIDNGKVKFVFRNFPLNQAALVAAMFADCQANNDNDKYFATIKALFKTQDSWAFDRNYKERLQSIAKLDGMNSEIFTKCIENKSLQEQILTSRMATSKILQLKSAPSFFINGEISEGYVDYKTIQTLIDKKLSEAQK